MRYANDTASFGKFNDQISSVRVGPSTTAGLFSDGDYKGNMKVLTGDVNYVGSDFNDKACR